MGTKSNPGLFDYHTAAEPDEPLFVLLGRDKHAPCIVWLWAALRELDGEDPAKVKEARECVVNMLEWQHAHGKKAVGFSQATLAGVMELIRTVNGLINDKGIESKTEPTDLDVLRRFFAETKLEKE